MARPENNDKAETVADTSDDVASVDEVVSTDDRATDEEATDQEAMPCPVYDQLTGRPCEQPMEPDRLTCKEHDTRSSSTQISRLDAARRRYGV